MSTDRQLETTKPRGRHPDKRLTGPAIRAAAPGRHADGNGLYLQVDPNGAKRWVLRVVVHRRRRDIGLGGLPYVSLADAREAARALRKVAREGGDPIAERDKGKRSAMTFEEAARIVHARNIAPVGRNPKAVAQWLASLEAYVFPLIGARPVATIAQADVLRALAPIWLDKPETARRVKQRIKAVLDWARANGMGEGQHPTEGVAKALPRQTDRGAHFAAAPWREVPALYAALAAMDGMGALATRFVILTAARSGEARGATWREVDLGAAVWTIPGARMKAGLEHRVPLSEPALALLAELSALGDAPDALVFPSTRVGRPLSDMTLGATLKRLAAPYTVHGFRSAFRDWTEEATAYPHEVKEAALAHRVRDKTEAAYRRTDHFEKRRALMREWAAFVVTARSE